MARAILVLNAGSSSLKFSIFLDDEPPTSFVRGQVEGLFTLPHFIARDAQGAVIGEQEWPSGTKLGHAGAVEFLFQWGRTTLGKQNIVAAGHRVGHGGRKFTRPVLVNADVMHALEEFVPLAPLHQPHNLGAIQAVAKQAPALPQVACFDTAFHRRQPPVAQAFALPRRFADEGVIRYGFHGISYEYIASVLPNVDPRAATGRTIVLHLGSGASACAIHNGQSVATTMTFSPLDGLPMGTRSGSLDPGVMLYLMDRHGMDARALEKLLYKESGLLGISGFSSDMRALLGSSDPHAAEAVDYFVYCIGREIGSLAAALNGFDALVFTGGIGENAAEVRARVCTATAWLGLEFDEAANQSNGPRISRPNSRVAAWIIPTNEEFMIAQHTRRVLADHF
jgi:acetate kinase